MIRIFHVENIFDRYYSDKIYIYTVLYCYYYLDRTFHVEPLFPVEIIHFILNYNKNICFNLWFMWNMWKFRVVVVIETECVCIVCMYKCIFVVIRDVVCKCYGSA